MTKKKTKIDFPIFSIHGNYLSEEIEQAVNLRTSIVELTDVVEDCNKKLINVGNRLNIYINNVIKRPKPFNFTEHMVVFSDDYEISIYAHEEVDELFDGEDFFEVDDEELYEKLPPTNDKYILNKKQTTKCAELMDEYNDIYDDYECSLYDLDECSHWYNYIIEGFKEELSEIRLFDLKKNKSQITEPFNEEKHELLITREAETGDWKLIYIRKEDKSKFLKFIKETQQELEKQEGDCD